MINRLRSFPLWLVPPLFVLILGYLHVLGLTGVIGPSGSWGLQPRQPGQWVHLLSFHLRHANWEHLFSNAFPLLFLGSLVAVLYPKATPRAWLLLLLGSGPLVWMFGKDGYHVGASALAYGLFHFLLGMGLWRRDRPALAGAFMAVLLFGGMFLAWMAPEGVSWEGHLSGAIMGHVAAFLWRKQDPFPEPIVWEDDTQNENNNPSRGLVL
jgi:membrane associated rhomboid family serine protease